MASAIRGSRVGAGPMGEAERGDSIARAYVSYWCANGHEVRPSFAVEETVVIPAEWDSLRIIDDEHVNNFVNMHIINNTDNYTVNEEEAIVIKRFNDGMTEPSDLPSYVHYFAQ